MPDKTEPLVFQDIELPVTYKLIPPDYVHPILVYHLTMCTNCGLFVGDPFIHEAWHSDMGPHES